MITTSFPHIKVTTLNDCYHKIMIDRGTCKRRNCNRKIKKGATRYCSFECQWAFLQERYIEKWKSGGIDGSNKNRDGASYRIRQHLLETFGKCSICGWAELNMHTGRIPLHLDHIDGDAANNRPDNLRLLCPNHHSLTPTYGNANKGKGRPGRRKRYLKGVKLSPLIVPTAGNGIAA